jgi:hypothetical protein
MYKIVNYTEKKFSVLILCLFHFLTVPPFVTKRASSTCIDHISNKFPEKMVFYGPHFSSALSDLCFLSFVLCRRFLWIRLFLLCWFVELPGETLGLEGALHYSRCLFAGITAQLLTDFINHLYDVFVSVRRTIVRYGCF